MSRFVHLLVVLVLLCLSGAEAAGLVPCGQSPTYTVTPMDPPFPVLEGPFAADQLGDSILIISVGKVYLFHPDTNTFETCSLSLPASSDQGFMLTLCGRESTGAVKNIPSCMNGLYVSGTTVYQLRTATPTATTCTSLIITESGSSVALSAALVNDDLFAGVIGDSLFKIDQNFVLTQPPEFSGSGQAYDSAYLTIDTPSGTASYIGCRGLTESVCEIVYRNTITPGQYLYGTVCLFARFLTFTFFLSFIHSGRKLTQRRPVTFHSGTSRRLHPNRS